MAGLKATLPADSADQAGASQITDFLDCMDFGIDNVPSVDEGVQSPPTFSTNPFLSLLNS